MSDTIAAVATPRGTGGIAVIRISGPGAHECARRVFDAGGRAFPHATAVYGKIISGGRAVDSGMLTLFAAPRSYTGEDVAELSCHGGVIVTNLVLQAVLNAGARLAEAGEFTRRALLNGKLTLTGAEAVGVLLGAVSAEGARAAAAQTSGAMSRAIASLSEKITALTAHIYANIDYPGEDLGELPPGELRARIEAIRDEVAALAGTFSYGEIIAKGIPCAIVGKVNAGKSTIFNLLAGSDAAIVTPVPGTTRDALRLTVGLGGHALRLCDTAGLRETADEVERIGVERARSAAAEARLLLCVFDNSAPLDSDDERTLALARAHAEKGLEAAALINKCDAEPRLDARALAAALGPGIPILRISARDDRAYEASLSAREALAGLVERLFPADAHAGDGSIVLSERQYGALVRARDALAAAAASLAAGQSDDVAGIDLELALAALAECDARMVSDSIIDEIFRNFCVGK